MSAAVMVLPSNCVHEQNLIGSVRKPDSDFNALHMVYGV